MADPYLEAQKRRDRASLEGIPLSDPDYSCSGLNQVPSHFFEFSCTEAKIALSEARSLPKLEERVNFLRSEIERLKQLVGE